MGRQRVKRHRPEDVVTDVPAEAVPLDVSSSSGEAAPMGDISNCAMELSDCKPKIVQHMFDVIRLMSSFRHVLCSL